MKSIVPSGIKSTGHWHTLPSTFHTCWKFTSNKHMKRHNHLQDLGGLEPIFPKYLQSLHYWASLKYLQETLFMVLYHKIQGKKIRLQRTLYTTLHLFRSPKPPSSLSANGEAHHSLNSIYGSSLMNFFHTRKIMISYWSPSIGDTRDI